MGETLPIFSTTFNGSVQVEARADHLSADSGALLLREILERTGIVEWMTRRLVDPRDPNTITYPLADLLRTSVLLLGQGWRDQDDADRLRHDPSFRVANDTRRGTAALE
ncbi:MAG: transposase, partial [Nitrospinae bacterium]|nr:transposase [Nitrospinota bacterium]